MKGDINPAQAQRKKDKAKEIKRSKAQVLAQRNERLAHIKIEPFLRKIRLLEDQEKSNGLSGYEKRNLQEAKDRLEEIRKAKRSLGENDDNEPEERQSGWNVSRQQNNSNERSNLGDSRRSGPGYRSIYWDPILNPLGTPPKGYPYQTRQTGRGRSINEEEPVNIDISLLSIPLPKARERSQERAKTIIAETKTTYESAPVLRDLVKESSAMIPAAVQKRRKIESIGESSGSTAQDDKASVERSVQFERDDDSFDENDSDGDD